MNFIKNNLALLIGALFIFTTATIRLFLNEPEFIWIGSIGLYVFITAVIGQFYITDRRLHAVERNRK